VIFRIIYCCEAKSLLADVTHQIRKKYDLKIVVMGYC